MLCLILHHDKCWNGFISRFYIQTIPFVPNFDLDPKHWFNMEDVKMKPNHFAKIIFAFWFHLRVQIRLKLLLVCLPKPVTASWLPAQQAVKRPASRGADGDLLSTLPHLLPPAPTKQWSELGWFSFMWTKTTSTQQIPTYMTGARILNLVQNFVVHACAPRPPPQTHTGFKYFSLPYNRKHKLFHKKLICFYYLIEIDIQKHRTNDKYTAQCPFFLSPPPPHLANSVDFLSSFILMADTLREGHFTIQVTIRTN